MQTFSVRFTRPDVAVADGRWELTGVVDGGGVPKPATEGRFTMVVSRELEGWRIAGYRYSVGGDLRP